MNVNLNRDNLTVLTFKTHNDTMTLGHYLAGAGYKTWIGRNEYGEYRTVETTAPKDVIAKIGRKHKVAGY